MASLSIDELPGGRYKLRWRELVAGPDGRPQRGKDKRLLRRDRSLTVEGKDARDEAVGNIRRALLAEGEYQPPTASDAPTVANLEQASLAWLEWKATRCKASSIVRYADQTKRFFRAVRELKGMGEQQVVSADVLGRDLLTQVVRGWQKEGLSESFVYNASRAVLEMWTWASDDPLAYPGVPTPPRHSKSVLPRPPVYAAPPAPTMAECDAALRHLPERAEIARRLGIVLRFTGLRLGQALGLRVADVDVKAATMVVRRGKSRLEAAECRVVPISRLLAAEIGRWSEGRDADAPVIAPRSGGKNEEACTKAYRFTAAWTAAVAAGEARDTVWRPLTRKQARPEHAFRAAFQAHLRIAGVPEPVIDALVGHHSSTTRAKHYAGLDTLETAMRAAVDGLPPIDWTGPKRAKGGKVVAMRTKSKAPVSGAA